MPPISPIPPKQPQSLASPEPKPNFIRRFVSWIARIFGLSAATTKPFSLSNGKSLSDRNVATGSDSESKAAGAMSDKNTRGLMTSIAKDAARAAQKRGSVLARQISSRDMDSNDPETMTALKASKKTAKDEESARLADALQLEEVIGKSIETAQSEEDYRQLLAETLRESTSALNTEEQAAFEETVSSLINEAFSENRQDHSSVSLTASLLGNPSLVRSLEENSSSIASLESGSLSTMTEEEQLQAAIEASLEETSPTMPKQDGETFFNSFLSFVQGRNAGAVQNFLKKYFVLAQEVSKAVVKNHIQSIQNIGSNIRAINERLSQDGLRRVISPGDGDCFYHSILTGLNADQETAGRYADVGALRNAFNGYVERLLEAHPNLEDEFWTNLMLDGVDPYELKEDFDAGYIATSARKTGRNGWAPVYYAPLMAMFLDRPVVVYAPQLTDDDGQVVPVGHAPDRESPTGVTKLDTSVGAATLTAGGALVLLQNGVNHWDAALPQE